MVLFGRAGPDAVVVQTVLAVSPEEVSKIGKAVSAVVLKKWVCPGRIPENGFGAGAEDSGGMRIFEAAVGRGATSSATGANEFGLGRGCDQRRDATGECV